LLVLAANDHLRIDDQEHSEEKRAQGRIDNAHHLIGQGKKRLCGEAQWHWEA
jgi:hypothetical protein